MWRSSLFVPVLEEKFLARAAQRGTVTLTCLQDRVPFYEALGYANEGPSASAHAGAQWFNMVKPLA